MKFNDMQYTQINIEQWLADFDKALASFVSADQVKDKVVHIDTMNQLRGDFETMENLASIRQSIDTKDTYYEEQVDFFDNNTPLYQQKVTAYYKALTTDPLKDALKNHYGAHLFNMAELQLKVFDDAIMEDLALENQLSTKYTKLRAAIAIEFEGESYNLSQFTPFLEVVDRHKRQAAFEAREAALEKSGQAMDDLYDQMVKVRHKIAKKLGYDNFVQLGYDRLGRTDYSAKDVEAFRQGVLTYLVPQLTPLYDKQRVRLGVDTLKYFDLSLNFTSGNPTPKGEEKWILEGGRKMYHELSKETGEFIDFMLDHELMDLVAKPGKAGGGYCTYIRNYRSPFIFSNFNGTMGDIDVLTHEAGHAFQVYQSRDYSVPEYLWPTLEACEIHSMSMEFLAYPWMGNFFKEDTEKYYFAHMFDAIKFIPYGVLVDHFQHWVYENPEASPGDRKAMWRQLEKTYLPHINYDGHAFLESGTYWYRQGHIFKDPFYYIDYTLAAVCAFQFWQKSQKDAGQAFNDYLYLCKLGGSLPFTQLVDEAKLKQPFIKETLSTISEDVVTYLNSIDDTKF